MARDAHDDSPERLRLSRVFRTQTEAAPSQTDAAAPLSGGDGAAPPAGLAAVPEESAKPQADASGWWQAEAPAVAPRRKADPRQDRDGRLVRSGADRPAGPARQRLGRGGESDDLYTTLVAELAHSLVPSTIMGLTILAIGVYGYLGTGGDLVALAATALGTLASAAKIALLLGHRRRVARPFADPQEARGWERAHVATTSAVAGSVGALSATLFAQADNALHMLATALVFGYCSGVASRLFNRPQLAMAALVVAAVPAAVSALTFGGTPERILAVIILAFLGGALESVRHLYGAAANQIEMRLRMGEVARTDALTGLANRFVLEEAAHWFENRREGFAAVHCFDLDDFKSVNDRFGHAAGDDLLRQVAARLRAFLAQRDLAIRVGGDEFAVLQPMLERPEAAERFARQLLQALTKPYHLAGQRVEIGISHGYAVSLAGATDLDAMMRAADSASYRAKWRGGGLEQAV